jgi:hypothetical protein
VKSYQSYSILVQILKLLELKIGENMGCATTKKSNEMLKIGFVHPQVAN